MSASSVQAWGDGPLCAMPEGEASELLSVALPVEPEADEPSDLCSLDEPLLDGSVPQATASESAEQVDQIAAARAALRQADAFAKAGQREDALLQLRVVERELPRVADRFTLRRADLLLALGMPEQAREAYALAAQSPNREVAIRAEIGVVHGYLQAAQRKGEAALQALLTRYPRLPQRHELGFELAIARERWGSQRGAVEALRRIDLAEPASAIAERARAELASLAQRGVRVAPYSGKERVERATRLLFDAPLEQAAAEVEALQNDRTLGAELHAQVLALGVRIARVQGRFEQASVIAQRGVDAGAAEREPVERRIRAIRAGKPVARLNNAQLRSVFEIALAHGLTDLCDETLDMMRTRRGVDAVVRFDAAIRASGLASDRVVAAVLETLLDVPRYHVAARYHYARALERSGRASEAEAEYLRVIASDHGSMQYYAMWADLRLWTMRSQTRESCLPHDAPAFARNDGPDSKATLETDVQLATADEATVTAALKLETTPEVAPRDGGAASAKDLAPAKTLDGERPETSSPELSLVGAMFDTAPQAPSSQSARARESDRARRANELEQPARLGVHGPIASLAGMAARARSVPAPEADPAVRRQHVLALLAPIAARHAEAYPWLARAQDLVELDLFEEAADEINEAYLAYRDASGALRLRSGLLALLTGSAPPRRSVTYALARARRALDREERMVLSQVANLLGDPGVGVRFGRERLDERPRAYAELVERAAREHGLDPNLLFAVMRVESIYNRRIISNAGAVGLMQIMPATGERIAHKLGVESFDASELLDPQLNLDFSAWYLASLLQRFDGRLPLAIASYNGGPHNVRLWMRQNPPHMPLDAFLERIPFSQTHEYVRRVLAYYAQYRAQQNLPMTRLSVELPQLRPDTMAF